MANGLFSRYHILLLAILLNTPIATLAQGNLITPTSFCEQSSTYHSPPDEALTCELAIDRNVTTFSHTTDDFQNQWWMVDLGQTYCIGSIYIKSGSLLSWTGMSIRTSMTADIKPAIDSPVWKDVGVNSYIRRSNNLTITPATRARYVAIINFFDSSFPLPVLRYLILQDVRVYENLDACPATLAQGNLITPTSFCEQSSTYHRTPDEALTCELAIDRNVTTFSNTTDDVQNQWWMVDLGQTYCMGSVYIKSGSSLSWTGMSIRTSMTADIKPALDSPVWKDVGLNAYNRRSNNLTITPATRARYVAIINFFDSSFPLPVLRYLILQDVRVYENLDACSVPESPATLTLIEVERTGNEQASCLKLEWTESPELHGVFKAYRYECNHTGSSGFITNVNTLMVRVCGLPAGESIRCSISVENEAKISASTSATSTTICRNPETDSAKGIEFGDQRVVSDSTRGSLIRLPIFWPAFRSNCPGEVTYKLTAQIQIGAQQSIERTGLTGTSLALGGLYAYTGYTVTLTVTNSRSDTTMLSKDITTRPASPHASVRSLSLDALAGSGVIRLSWQPPMFPNGEAQYNYGCTISDNGNSEERNSSDTTERSITFTYLEPGLSINCTVCAFNMLNGGKLVGPSASVSKQVECSDPTTITTFEDPKEMVKLYPDGRTYLDVEFTWMAPRPFCTSIANYTVSAEFSLNEGPIMGPVSTQTASVKLEKVWAYSNVTLTVLAVNDKGFSSSSTYTFTSRQLAPYGPPEITGSSANTSCVSLSWNPPEWTNGPITNHTLVCYESGLITGSTTRLTTEFEQAVLCGFDPAIVINCSLISTNVIGDSPSAYHTLKTTDVKQVSENPAENLMLFKMSVQVGVPVGVLVVVAISIAAAILLNKRRQSHRSGNRGFKRQGGDGIEMPAAANGTAREGQANSINETLREYDIATNATLCEDDHAYTKLSARRGSNYLMPAGSEAANEDNPYELPTDDDTEGSIDRLPSDGPDSTYYNL